MYWKAQFRAIRLEWIQFCFTFKLYRLWTMFCRKYVVIVIYVYLFPWDSILVRRHNDNLKLVRSGPVIDNSLWLKRTLIQRGDGVLTDIVLLSPVKYLSSLMNPIAQNGATTVQHQCSTPGRSGTKLGSSMTHRISVLIESVILHSSYTLLDHNCLERLVYRTNDSMTQ